MRNAWWAAALVVCGTAGCGCNGTATVASGSGTQTPDSVPTAVGNGAPVGPGPVTGTVEGAKARPDPTPAPLRALFDKLLMQMEPEEIEALRADVDAERDRHPEDPVAWYATVLVRTEHASLQMRRKDQPSPDVAPIRTALARARELDVNRQYEWLGRCFDGRVAVLTDDPKGAVAAAEDVVRLAPGFVRGRVHYAQLMMLDKRVDQALEWLTQDAKEWPNRVEIWAALAMVHLAKRDALRALECLETAVALRPDLYDLRRQRLAMLLQIWREVHEQKHETQVRQEIAELKKLAATAIRNARSRELELRDLAEVQEQFEVAVAEIRLRDVEQLPAAERTTQALLGRIATEDGRRFVVLRAGVRVGDGTVADPTIRVQFLLEVLAQDPSEKVRIDAVRGLVYDGRARDPRGGKQTPWPPEVLEKVRPVALPALLAAAVDPGLPRTLRIQVLVAAKLLAAPDPAALAAVHARLVLVVPEFLQARESGEGDSSAVYDELTGLTELLARLAGRGLPTLPHHREDGDEQFRGWLERLGALLR